MSYNKCPNFISNVSNICSGFVVNILSNIKATPQFSKITYNILSKHNYKHCFHISFRILLCQSPRLSKRNLTARKSNAISRVGGATPRGVPKKKMNRAFGLFCFLVFVLTPFLHSPLLPLPPRYSSLHPTLPLLPPSPVCLPSPLPSLPLPLPFPLPIAPQNGRSVDYLPHCTVGEVIGDLPKCSLKRDAFSMWSNITVIRFFGVHKTGSGRMRFGILKSTRRSTLFLFTRSVLTVHRFPDTSMQRMSLAHAAV